ncbi:MAG TPA: DUF2585 family protein [Pyrinomonadaceae bacterium]|nr:DUF2585 family protein [Pyrinomonadaceae bacterium]
MSRKYRVNVIYPILAMMVSIVGMVIALYWQGRVWWCKVGDLSPWSSDIWSTHNSQHFFDPYTFTHILHGVLYFWIINLIFREMPLRWKFFLVIFVECGWELLENSNFVIERYRAATISLDYFGDSILNSLSDVLSCSFGAFLAYKLKFWRSLIYFAATEILLLFLIRDNLTLNIIMLIYPIDAIKQWQMGG